MEQTTTIASSRPRAMRHEALRHRAGKATDARSRNTGTAAGFLGPGVRLFAGIRFMTKALVVGSVLTLPVLALLFWQLSARYDDAWDGRMRATMHHVEIAQAVLARFHDQELAEEITREQAQWLAKHTIAQLRYNGNEYFWIHDVSAKMVIHPLSPALNDKDLGNLRDADGKAFFQEMIEVSKKHGGGFVRYLWQNPGDPAPIEKISYVKNSGRIGRSFSATIRGRLRRRILRLPRLTSP